MQAWGSNSRTLLIVLDILLQIRFLCAPKKVQFFFGAMNLVDLLAILPFFLDLIIGGLQVTFFQREKNQVLHVIICEGIF